MMNIDNGIGIREAETFLCNYYKIGSPASLGVQLLGEGAWSRCFGFQHGGEKLAIRFGNYVDDFEKDRRAYGYATPELPIPQVFDIGRAYDGHYAIATQVFGVPLESVGTTEWLTLVPSVVAALEAMRMADLSTTTGIGGWGQDGNASATSWSADLLAVARDVPDQRGDGWREKLAASPQGDADFVWGIDLLEQVVSDDIPRSLIHGDLINRNVLVKDGQLSGLFDWGCSRYGDHLYDLAWFEFWSPWYPDLDMCHLRSALEQHWLEIGYEMGMDSAEKTRRLMTCYLHIGLDHLRYNASIGDEVNLLASGVRMRELVD